MLRIGLTGGIGSGKTTVSDKFHQLYNIPVIDADKISHTIMQPNGLAYKEVIDFFGQEVLLPSKEINRKFLREKIFLDASLKKNLEAIIHPKVRLEINNQVKQLDSKYCLIVIPLLIESGLQSLADRILIVDALEENQINRVSQRDNCSNKEVGNIISNQIDAESRRKHADDIILNNSSIEDLDQQIHQLHKKYLALTT